MTTSRCDTTTKWEELSELLVTPTEIEQNVQRWCSEVLTSIPPLFSSPYNEDVED